MLLGRESECLRVESLLAQSLTGTGAALAVRGAPGVGKSALLAFAKERASGFRVLETRGVEAESELAFAALSDLLRPVLDLVASLPEPQAAALAGALAIGPPVAADRFATCAATLGVLAAAAEEAPVLALVDDAQWLDPSSAEAILFAARRLESEPMVFLFAARDNDGSLLDRGGLAEIELAGLEDRAARALVDERAPTPLASSVLSRLIDETAGNPLALIEIPAQLTPAQRSGDEALDDELPPVPAVERAFRRRLGELRAETQQALLLVAASDSRELVRVEQALASVGLDLGALEEAEDAGLVHVNAFIDLAHPLLRSTIYRAASAAERRAAHRALAGVEEAASRAWHLAAAAPHPDAEAAAALEETALAARGRGAYAEAASAFQRAAGLTAEPDARSRRLREAAADARVAGRPDDARNLLDQALAATGDPAARARIEHLRGVVEMWHGSARHAFGSLIAEAARVEPADPVRAARMLTDASWAAFMAGEIRTGLAAAERASALASGFGDVTEILARAVLGLALTLCGEPVRAQGLFGDYEAELLSSRRVVEWPWSLSRPVGQVQMWFERYDDARMTLTGTVDAARARSALGALPFALAGLSELDFRTGNWSAAYAGAAEGVRIAAETSHASGIAYCSICLAQVAAGRGLEDECRAHLDEVLEIAGSRVGAAVAFAASVRGFLELGLGRTGHAVTELRALARKCREQGLRDPSVIQWAPNLIEAYVRDGLYDDAWHELNELEVQARRAERAGVLATAARCRGLLGADDFDSPFQEALALHATVPAPFERARTALCYGERLRRARRRTEAREQLRSALFTFERLGAEPWAARARREIAATGERIRRRDPAAAEQLTPTEFQVAQIVARGATNKEAGAALFLSPKTIETHLARVYRKLNVRSRTELAHLLAREHDAVATAEAPASRP